MSISSISSYLSYYQIQTNYSNRINTAQQTSSNESSQSTNVIFSSSDGDTFELTGDQTGMSNVFGSYGPPPPPPPAQMSSQGDSTDPDPIKAFLDKVADGTATADDLTSMQSVLSQMQSQAAGDTSNTSSTDGSDSIKTFLDKVANGTATTDDLTSMQSVLSKMHHHHQVAQASADDTSNMADTANSDPIKAFLDKVASGTATTDDLTTMQSFLAALQTTSSQSV